LIGQFHPKYNSRSRGAWVQRRGGLDQNDQRDESRLCAAMMLASHSV